jgi:hypothetical protein
MKDDDLLKSVKSWEELLRETKARHEEFIEARREIPSERTSDN